MSEENLETRASAMGWVPLDQWKDAPEKWTDAASFVEHGEKILPILKRNNQDLMTRLTGANNEINALKEKVDSTTVVIEDLKKFHTEEMTARVKDAKARIITDLAAARKDENVGEEIRLTQELDDLRTAEVAAKTEDKATPPPAKKTITPDPIVAAWSTENPWFGQDEEKTAFALGAAEKLRKSGLVGQPLLDAMKKRVDEVFAPVRREFVDRTEGTRTSGSGGSSGGGSDYASLPAEARAKCDSLATKFVGKPGFPDEASWRKHYVTQYNAGA